MTGQRNSFHATLVFLVQLTAMPSSWAGTPEILVPEPFAVELPAGVNTLSADDEPLRGLTARAAVAGYRVTLILPRERVGTGIWPAILSVWEGNAEHPAARRSATLVVLPHGVAPVGQTGDTNATAGNNTTHIVHDASGFTHMVWNDAWRPGGSGAYYRRARMSPDGSVMFDTDVVELAPHKGEWTAKPSLASAGNTVHFTWQVDGTARYRFLRREGETWRWSEEMDTRARIAARDIGPSIVADTKGVYILTPAGVYTESRDEGRTWTTEAAPFGTEGRVKTQSLTLDRMGRPLAAASVVMKITPHLDEHKGHGGFWTFRIARRIAPGRWETEAGPVDNRPEWGPPTAENEDVLTDWVRLLEDTDGGMHATWHGTSVSRIYANDRAYYAYRPPGGTWQPPVSLREPDLSHGFGWSYAPGLILDGDRALPLVFHSMRAGQREVGFDSELGLFRGGRLIAPPLMISRFARDSLLTGEPAHALATWFPGAAPDLVRGSDGRVRADVLMTLIGPGGGPGIVAWRRVDVTDWLKPSTP